MSKHRLSIGVGRGVWHEEFAAALDECVRRGEPIDYRIVDIDCHDWQEKIAPYDLVIWRGRFLGPQAAGHYKAKVYFMERVLGKTVVPSYETVWSFDSKVEQQYLLAHLSVPTPKTVATFDYDDAGRLLDQEQFPIVVKRSYGAAGSNVRLIRDRRQAQKWLDSLFFHEKWMRHKQTHPGALGRVLAAPFHRWIWPKVHERLLRGERHAVAYWQEYLADNHADLRVTVIGDRDAFAFWRHNRPGDFRASGSGLLDYERPVPIEVVSYCVELSRRLGFDSMAYDILFKQGSMVIVEMSYAYVDKALRDAPGHFVLDDQALVYREGHTTPQALWVDWAIRKASNSSANSA